MQNPFVVSGGQVSVLRVPLRQTFITALGRQDITTNVGFRIRLRDGSEGYGEASGSIVLAYLSPAKMARALRAELNRLIGSDARRLRSLIPEIWERRRTMTPAAAAVECALIDALTRSQGTTMAEWFGGAKRELHTDLTISAAPPDLLARTVRRALSDGFRQLKIKVGTGPGEDWMRLSAIWNAIQDERKTAQILLDGNQGMTVASAMRLVEKCLKAGIKPLLLEQPVRRDQVKALRDLKQKCPVPIAADESVWSTDDALRLLDMDAVDILNLKVAKTGLQASLEIISLVQAAKKLLMIGCMRETAAGLSPSVHLACGTGAFEFVDLDSDCLLAPKQPRGDFTRAGPHLTLT